jgi:putative tryptophan/tyrosine transport system substrate-binding protein
MRPAILLALGLVLLGGPSAAAQDTPRTARIGWISTVRADHDTARLNALRAGLAQHGWIEGRNYILLPRNAEGDLDRIAGLATELLKEKLDVIVTQGPALHRVHSVVQKIPVIYGFSGDPVVAGYAESLARPRGNLTGVSFMAIELNGKRLDMLREIMPRVGHVAIIANPTHAGDHLEFEDSEATAKRLGIRLQYWPVRSAAELDAAFAGMDADRPEAIVAFPDAVIMELRARIVRFGLDRRIPAISGWAAFAQSGGLFTYGPKLTESYRRLAYYVDRVLRGAKTTDLPVERPTVVELVVNLKTAQALGIEVPPTLLARADEVIE